MNISLVNKTLTIVDGNKTYVLREDNLVSLTLKSDYILLETNQVSTPQGIRIYEKFVTVPTHTSLLNLFAIVSAWYDVVKNDKLTSREIDGHVSRTLSYSEVIDTVIYNIGQSDTDTELILPTPDAGYRFKLVCGEPASHYLKITAPTGKMIVDGVPTQTSAQFATPEIGQFMDVFTAKVLPSVDGFITKPILSIGTTDKFDVKNTPFTYVIGGVVVSKASYETPTGEDVIPSAKWGATAMDINAAGEYSIVSASANATGYTTSALALAGLPAVETGKLRIGTIAVKKTGGAFIFGTTAFDATNVTVIFASANAIVPEYNWLVVKHS